MKRSVQMVSNQQLASTRWKRKGLKTGTKYFEEDKKGVSFVVHRDQWGPKVIQDQR